MKIIVLTVEIHVAEVVPSALHRNSTYIEFHLNPHTSFFLLSFFDKFILNFKKKTISDPSSSQLNVYGSSFSLLADFCNAPLALTRYRDGEDYWF